MTEYPHKFVLSGKAFQGRFLPPDTSLDVFAELAPALGEVLDKLDLKATDPTQMMADAFSAVLGSFKTARKAAPKFLSVYQVEFDGRMVPLESFKDETFQGKPALYVAFVIAAIKSEFSDFLHSSGFSTLQDLAKVCGFQITSKGSGQSGGSLKEDTQP